MMIKIKIIKYLFIYFLLNKMSKLDTDELKIKILSKQFVNNFNQAKNKIAYILG